MKKLKAIITSMILLATVSHVFGQFTRENAIDLVLNSILVDEIGEIDVYASYDEFLLGDTVFLAHFASYQICPYNNNWVFFSDDMPFVGWHHTCRYIFVDSNNGEYIIVEDDIYPKDIMADFEPVSFVEVTKPSPPDYINCGPKSEGMHHIDFNANGLKNGIYFYSLRINGQNTDSKKMTIMK